MSSKWLPSLALFLSSCASRPEQVNFVIRTAPGASGSIVEIVRDVARRAGMAVNEQRLPSKNGTAPIFLVDNFSVSVVIQASLVDCEPGKVRYDPCFSSTDYTVSIFRSTFLPAHPRLTVLAQMFSAAAKQRGAQVQLEPDGINASKS